MKPPRPLFRVFLRSFSVQGSWNFETMIGFGFGHALLPLLRSLHRERPDALREAVGRHSGFFNSHPYLAPLALGAVARLEAERQPPQLIERFKTAIRGALGGIGDQLVWAGWRPVCTLAALALLLLGAPWWLGVATFLLLYNAGHLGLRWWSFTVGWTDSLRLAATLRSSWIWRAERVLHRAGPFLVGLVIVVLAGRGVGGEAGGAVALTVAAAAAIGAAAGQAARRPLEVALLLLVLVGFLWSGR